ncbi:MAG: [FeFe] hydrogenase H-cluster radical SAM maturase HydG [Candidatus Omnitrophica bacterium]|nr:[FeFe] hydrogenase H-cluster radical SAM maturase HydG [Candidatus Omnitrophota bacterium]
MVKKIIDEKKINAIIEGTKNPSKRTILKVIEKAAQKKGLGLEEAGALVNLRSPELTKKLFEAAGCVKNEIYGERLVLFAPLYISDFCVNDCAYCNFHKSNKTFKRRKLTLDEIESQTRLLIDMGHKRLLVEAGEDPAHNDIDYVVSAIKRIYSVKTEKGNIRRVNVNIAAASAADYRKLKSACIGTYQLFQETYHRKTYEALHKGPKADYERQLTAYDRAFKAGIDDLGLGVLFGLYDWRFEALSLIAHSMYLETAHGVGPHTISVPRFQPAPTVTLRPAGRVSDNDFLKLIATLRVAVPYTGMIISTRESAATRKTAFKIGISQASAASNTTTGGYGETSRHPQFEIQDDRNLSEVIGDVVADGFLPSFCTACYRKGRTGETFMNLSKPGDIHKFCRPNGLLTFAEYLQDFGKNSFYSKGNELIAFYLNKIENEKLRNETKRRLYEIKKGKRDIYF